MLHYTISLFLPLQEAILEEQESHKDDNIHLTRFLRVLANFLVLCCLAGSGYLIYFVVRRSQKFALEGLENHTWWERNEVDMRARFHCFPVLATLSHQGSEYFALMFS